MKRSLIRGSNPVPCTPPTMYPVPYEMHEVSREGLEPWSPPSRSPPRRFCSTRTPSCLSEQPAFESLRLLFSPLLPLSSQPSRPYTSSPLLSCL